jgi:GNAT superfamily N-acetyltransferase
MPPPDADVDVHALELHEVERVVEQLPGRSRTQHERRLDAQRNGKYRYLIAWIDGVAVGHVGVGFPDDARIDELVEWRGLALVDDLYVLPPARGRGIGRVLMEMLEAEVRAAGMPGIGLDTGIDDGYAAARALYRDLGYEEVTGPFLVSARMPADAAVPVFVEILTVWTKRF